MTPIYFRTQIKQYLNEQEISYKKGESTRYLCLKAAIEGYSFSDEMIQDFSEYIPDEKEVEKYK
jgi:hypothetical protein